MLTQTWQNKWTETHDIIKESDLSIRGLKHSSSMGVMIESQMPHLVGMDDDILSTGVTIYHLKVRAMWRSFSSQGESNVKVFLISRWEQFECHSHLKATAVFKGQQHLKSCRRQILYQFSSVEWKEQQLLSLFLYLKIKIIRSHCVTLKNILKNIYSRLWTLT